MIISYKNLHIILNQLLLNYSDFQSSNILLDKKGRVKLLSLELSNRILKSFQSKNQDIIDFGSIFKVIKFKDGEYNKLLKGNEFTYY